MCTYCVIMCALHIHKIRVTIYEYIETKPYVAFRNKCFCFIFFRCLLFVGALSFALFLWAHSLSVCVRFPSICHLPTQSFSRLELLELRERPNRVCDVKTCDQSAPVDFS